MSTSELTPYERALLESWAETHKKSAIMFLILLALRDQERRVQELHAFFDMVSAGNLGIDAQSLHRALRRIEGLNLITHTEEAVSGSGVKRKVYALTISGDRLLTAYAKGTLSYLRCPEVQSLLSRAAATV